MKVGNHVMRLNPHITQTSPERKKYRVVGVAKDPSEAPQWIGKTEKYHWIVTIKYLETNELIDLFFDCYDQCHEKRKLKI
ncbi:hypothetical protein SAMN04488033_1455 [Salegentibacter agarivorans]|uniref:Uncharacterized protein n=1 Tax=Salegentibacter agarivorans TaxID=345907 RepID=A0A1I2Q994_9FLAO|nr:hypothetical protein [Salegentibacter agarivorans]SFG23949.1 hypothetical protein SAMN04488033_1455 [Salegentibacter agarivorans]